MSVFRLTMLLTTLLIGTLFNARASAQERRGPDVGEDQYIVKEEILNRAREAYQQDGRPSAEVWCAVQGTDNKLSSNEITASLESSISFWLLKIGMKIEGVADKEHELRQLGAIDLKAPDALAKAIATRRKAKLVFAVILFPSTDPARKGYRGRVQLLDLRKGLPVYDQSFGPLPLSDFDTMRRLAASVCRNTLEAYVNDVKNRADNLNSDYQVLVLGLDNREQAQAFQEQLIGQGAVTAATFEYTPGETSLTNFDMTTLLPKEQLIKEIQRAFRAAEIASEVIQDAGPKITILAGTQAGIPAKLIEEFRVRFVADQKPDFKLLVGIVQAGDPNKAIGADTLGLSQGLKFALVSELRRNNDLQLKDEMAKAVAQQAIVDQLLGNNEQALAEAVVKQYGRMAAPLRESKVCDASRKPW